MKTTLLQSLLEKNKRYVETKPADYFPNLAKGQSPGDLVLSCSDSRVSFALLTDSGLGEHFEVKNIANCAINREEVDSALCYAVNHLKVSSIYVCGHYGCGGVMAAKEIALKSEASQGLEAELVEYLAPLASLYLEHQAELLELDESEAHQRLVCLHVAAQVKAIKNISHVVGALADNEHPLNNVSGVIYDISTGLIEPIE